MDHCSNCSVEVNDNELFEVTNYDADEIHHVCAHCLDFYAKCDLCGMFRPKDLVTYEPETDTNICNLCQENEESAIPDVDIDLEEGSWRD